MKKINTSGLKKILGENEIKKSSLSDLNERKDAYELEIKHYEDLNNQQLANECKAYLQEINDEIVRIQKQ